MNKFGRRHKEHVPVLCFNPPAKIHVLVPCRKELLIETFDFFIRISTDHESRRCGLIDTNRFGLSRQGPAGSGFETEVFQNQSTSRRKLPWQVLIADVLSNSAGLWVTIHETL